MRFVLLLALVCACSSEKAAPPDEDPAHPKMKVDEQSRDLEICQKYVDRVCACAEKAPELPQLKDQCDLAKGQPEAVQLHMSLLKGIMMNADGGERHAQLNPEERRMTEGSLRNIVAACVAADGKLDPKTCPRK